MAALTLEQLRARSRAKFPVTVVRDENYTTMTPAEIAAEWSAYSGGTDGVYLQNVAGTWAEMDPDLPKSNDRGLLVFGGGSQIVRRCDFADVTVDEALPASWVKDLNGLTATCTAKAVINGLPVAQITVAGTSTATAAAISQPPTWQKFADIDVDEGDVIVFRTHVYIESLPAEVITLQQQLYSGAQSVNTNAVLATVDEWQVLDVAITEDTVAGAFGALDYVLTHANGATYSAPAVFSVAPSLATINTAFPDHFHCINTSTSSAATIVPEVMQRPMVLDEPWWAVIECDLPVRNVTGNHYIHEIAIDDNNRVNIIFSGAEVSAFLVVGGSNVAVVSFGNASPGEHVKVSFAATAQTMRGSLNGDAVVGAAAPRFSTTVSQSLGHGTFGSAHGFATFQNHSIGTGLVTDAQLIEWSTAA